MSGGPVEFRFKGDASDATEAVGRLGLSVERVEGKIKKMGDEAKRAKASIKESADAGEKGFAGMVAQATAVVGRITAIVAAAEAARRALIALEESSRKAGSEASATGQKFGQMLSSIGLENRGAFLEDRLRGMVSGPGGIGGKLEDTFAPLTAYERAGGQAGTLAGFNRFEKIMKAADASKVTNVTGFVEATQRLMNVDKSLSVEGAMGRAMLMQQAGVTDASGYIERMGGDADTATALAVLAKQSGQDIGVVEKIAARIQGVQAEGRKTIDVGGRKVADPATAGLFDASGAAIPLDEALRKFFGGEMPGLVGTVTSGDRSGKIGGAVRAMIGRGNLQSALNRARNAEGVMGASARALETQPSKLLGLAWLQEAIDDANASGEDRRVMNADRDARMNVLEARSNASFQGTAAGRVWANYGSMMFPARSAMAYANTVLNAPGADYAVGPTGQKFLPEAPIENVRDKVTAPAGYQVQVKIVKDGGSASPDAN